MANVFGYMRISTKEEHGKQKFTRQESALQKYSKEKGIEFTLVFSDDASGKNFDRPEWKKLESIIRSGDTIVFKDLCRFTREYENGFLRYMELLNAGIELIFIDNPTVSTPYIRQMMNVAEKQSNRIAQKSLRDTIELLLLVELDRAETERITTAQRIRDGIAASDKMPGREKGHLDKMTPELAADIERYMHDRSIKLTDLMVKHGVSRNTLKKYIVLSDNQ